MDSSVYYYLVNHFRDFDFDYKHNIQLLAGDLPLTFSEYNFDPQLNASIILSLIPIPFIINTASLGFTNKLIYIFTLVYLKNKKSLHNITLVVFLFYPTLIFYTSVGLKDTLVLCISCLTLFFL